MHYIYKIVSAAVIVLLWHAYHLNPETAQLRDILALLHSETVHGQFAVAFVVFMLLCEPMTYVSAVRHHSTDYMVNGSLAKEPAPAVKLNKSETKA